MKTKIKKIEKKWFKKWRKEYPDDIKKLEDEHKIPEEFEEDLEKLTEEFAKRWFDPKYNRVSVPEEDEGSFTELSDFSNNKKIRGGK